MAMFALWRAALYGREPTIRRKARHLCVRQVTGDQRAHLIELAL
jgi:hypothetical protein